MFVSANAVQQGLRSCRRSAAGRPTFRRRRWAQATARELRARGVEQVLVPQAGSDSEALLALGRMQQVAGRRIVIFRGVGGREHLADTLRAPWRAGEYVECYRRIKPEIEPEPLLGLLARGELHAVVAASTEALANLVELCRGAPRACCSPCPCSWCTPR